MKKIVVILLLTLPFFLIYSISFTGKILSQYTHISVERIVLLNQEGDEYEEGSIIKIAKGETAPLDICIYPELASNKDYTISNSDQTVCSIDEATSEVTGLEYGTSRIVLTSKDTPVSFTFYIKVSDDDIQEIQVNKTDVTIAVNKYETIETTILPITTLQENRRLVWESADPSIATVNANGKITGVSAGTTTVTVRSAHKSTVFTVINVTVEESAITPVFFNVPDGTYTVKEATLDLNAITAFTVEGYTNLRYTVISNSSNADLSRLGEGFITFNNRGIYKVKVSIVYDGQPYEDELTIFYNP